MAKNIKEAKAELKKYGRVIFRGVQIVETKKMNGNWQEYTGRYWVTPEGHEEPINDDAVTIGKAFELAKPHFQG